LHRPLRPAAYRRDPDGRRDNPKAAARDTLDTTGHDNTAVIC
jgi:hypothetical protein